MNTTEHKNDPLAGLLREWAGRRAADPKRIEALTERISQAVRREPAPVREETTAVILRPVWGRVVYAALGAAAAVALLLSVFPTGPGGSLPGGQGVILAEAGGMNGKGAQEKLTLFREVNAMFGQQIRGLVETGDRMVIDVAGDRTSAQLEAAPVVVVQMKMMTRKVGSATWTPVWSADVVARGEELVEMAADPETGNRMLVWAYPLEDGTIAVDSTVELTAPMKIKCTGSHILAPGKAVSIQSAKAGSDEYQIFQTARVLSGAGAKA